MEIDRTDGGIDAGSSFEFSEATAGHIDEAASRARGVLPGEFREFTPGLVFSIACPTIPTPRPAFIEAYQALRVVIDGEVEIALAEHPRLLSEDLEARGMLNGVRSYIPRALMPAGSFGRSHTVELLQGDDPIFGPVDRFFHTETSGAVFDHIEDAPGRLVLEVRGDLGVLAQRGEILFFTDPSFGEPTAVTQVDDGAARALDWHMLASDRVGDQLLFNEWTAAGVAPRDGARSLVVEVHFAQRGIGLAAGLFAGHTRDTAFRADATVL